LPHNPPDRVEVKKEAIDAIYEAQVGIHWLCTRGRGLSEFDTAAGPLTYHQHGWDPTTGLPAEQPLSDNSLCDVVEDESGNLWIGTWERSSTHDRETGQRSVFRHDPRNP
jgi:ligand-binding sensor domain-containing protein